MSRKNLLFVFSLCVFAILQACNTNQSYNKLQDGDLLFIVGKSKSEQNDAIKKSTSKKDEIPFSHVGIVKFVEKDVYVIEATTSDGIIQTLLYEFMQKAEKQKGKPLVAVGRVKPEFQYIVSLAVEKAEEQLGRPYDYAYEEGNDAYYCTELVRFTYLDSLRNPIFPALAMTFKNKETGETEAYWEKHFAGLQLEIPEGKPGTNPVDMSKSSIIDIVYKYY
ncbi:MAG: YiiX/YebB-like N1pC/P60 family cysteine hydrolase [Bacteroidia bacterium]|nr:YiiX/YebB-like N1pC/P60 family cysteine hydrolase [Bacteroidia bacterium]